jgi:putative RecB family exonuclease
MIALAPPAQEVGVLPRHISPSAAKSYLSCSLKFYFERVLQLPAPTSPALHLGKAIHAALQAFHLARWRGGEDTPESVATAFEHAFNDLERDEGPVRWKNDADRTKAYDAGLRVLAAYLDSDGVLEGQPIAVEVPLTENIEGLPVPLTGMVDLVSGDMVAIDFKSSAATPNPRQAAFDHEIQLVVYQLLIEQASGQTPKSLDLIFLVKTKTPKVIRVSSPPAGPARKARVIELLNTAVEGMAAGRFHPQPGMQCSWCPYRKQCGKWPGSMQKEAA